jgi:alkanesulfonate monooxygenase SsuD/methylene tetrahydromethanopterin reductase-like flavin-dependent oxidoreductase (luciferase family)
LAESIINLDHVSNGRAICGFGGGLAPHEFRRLRIDQNKSRRAVQRHPRTWSIPALESGILEGETETISQPRVELRPAAAQELRGAQVLRLAARAARCIRRGEGTGSVTWC